MMMKNTLTATAIASLATAAFAEKEDGLYGAALPKDAIFVRAIDLAEPSYYLFGRTIPGDKLPDGTFVAFAPELLPEATPGAHYSLVAGENALPFVIEEGPRDNPAKVQLSLLNIDASNATLAVAGGGPEVVADVTEGSVGARWVNPVSVTLEARIDDAETAQIDVTLRRKQHMTILARADGSVELLEDTYGPIFDGASD